MAGQGEKRGSGTHARSAPHVRVRDRLRQALLLVSIGMVGWSARAFLDYGRLASRLAGKTLLERGRIASDEGRNFLARAGRPRTQAAIADLTRSGRLAGWRSGVADGWEWVAATGMSLPSDAKVYLNVPSDLLYYYATTFWYPRRVSVTTGPATIRDGDTLRSALAPVDPSGYGELRRAGYTHVVTATSTGLSLVDLRRSAPGGAP